MRNYSTDFSRNEGSWRDLAKRNNKDRGSSKEYSWGARTSTFEELPPVEFKKNFYSEKPHISKMSEDEVIEFREKHEMKIKGKNVPKPVKSFEDLSFKQEILRDFEKKQFSHPTPIQAQGWPMALSGRDMVGIAQTGSGKTISFVLPALIHAADQPPLRRNDGPIVLILAPTRELCLQIKEVVDQYTYFFRMKSTAVYGGVSAIPQRNDLRSGVEVLVATPGRLIDLYKQGCLSLKRVTFLVLDEADRMLDMGFEPQLKEIIPETNPNRQTLMWSATWPKEVRNLAESYMKDFIQVNIGQEELTSNLRIKQITKICEERDKNGNLLDVLKSKKGENIYRMIVFCNKKRTCDDIEYLLQGKGFSAVAIHGDKSQAVRDRVISDFKSGRKHVLIATDVAARGLDVKDVKMVINYDFPSSCEDYIHRIGRTARGDTKEGISLTFFTFTDKNNSKELIRILTDANQEVPRELREMVPRGEVKRFSRYGGRSNYSSSFHKRW
ncbi:ATP-dependent RNA helicase dbp2 [Hamiltosporidium tvaerminnensis]|uniref:RNA helicase n=2 Tax=Hamiltosporidium TaxID=1176354 RepID=A0A4Q9LCG0_9MICR|nr:ATP-dependent RNA helicase dbp2 [Hamiltosporidium tvaerminnensis]TBU05573.1 ATP-dependent RNA helicase [Hamiltosporidium magnivora]